MFHNRNLQKNCKNYNKTSIILTILRKKFGPGKFVTHGHDFLNRVIENETNLTHSCPRDLHLSASWGSQLKATMKTLKYHRALWYRGV